jgi:hypothetical protein
MKSRLIPIGLMCVGAGLARADFKPVPLTPGSYTFAIVVPAGTVQPTPDCINATVGGGTSEGDTTFYEQGFAAPPGYPGVNSGIPLHNTVFTNISNPHMTFLMPPDLTVNNDLMIYSTETSGTFAFTTPTTATNLAILGTDGGGGMTINYTVTHQNNSTESGSINGLDWFNGSFGATTVAWGANARIGPNGGVDWHSYGSANTTVPYLYAYKITVSGASPIVSIKFNYTSGTAYANFYAVSGNASGPSWTPIPVTGFNLKTTVPAALPYPVTATMDNGTNLSGNGGIGNTWFEQGYYTGNSNDGLPPSGTTFNSLSNPSHHYQMGNYSSNNAILIDTNHLIANITPATLVAYTALSFLTAGGDVGGGQNTNICIVQHQDGVNETNVFYGYDWYNGNIAPAFIANGRVNMSDHTLNTLGGNDPRLFETYFNLADTNSPVTNMVVKNVSVTGYAATTFIMAVSGSTVPVAPLITSGPLPASQEWYPSQTATFTVMVSGSPPITNTWLVESNGVYVPLTDGVDANGSTVSGSGTTTLTISGLTKADGTNYEYAATNGVGGVISTNALLIINSATPVKPIIDSQVPAASIATLNVLTNHTTPFSVTIDAASAPPVYYQWYGGLPQTPANAIPNATSATYANFDASNVTISCIITNFVGAATSSPVALNVITPTPTPYEAAVFACKPVSYWPLNETAGTTAFDYVGTNDGTYVGGCLLDRTGDPSAAGLGANNTSVAFNGSTAYVDIPVNNLNITNAMSVLAWVLTPSGGEAGGHYGTVLGHSDQSYRLTIVNTAPRFDDAGPDDTGTANVGDGNWHHVVGVYDGTNQYVYADGQPTGLVIASAQPLAGSGYDVWIGGAPDYAGARNFNGNLAQVAILTNALTAAQVEAIYYSAGIPPTVPVITPANPAVYVGASVTLTASTSGSPPLRFQWYYIDISDNSNNIAGATNAAYTIADASPSQNNYQYGVNVRNVYGAANASVYFTVENGPPFLVAGGDISPLNGEAYVGAPVTYTVNVLGTEPIFYQWTVDGNSVSGATNSSFTAPAACGLHAIQVSMTNSQNVGSPLLSSVAMLQGDAYPANITFNTNGAGWQLNTVGVGSVPTITSNVLELTDGDNSEAATAFYVTAQYVGTFSASFTYTAAGNKAADGAAFILQNSSAGSNALGAGGGGLGYGGMTDSAGVQINIYGGNGLGGVGIGFGTNGAIAQTVPTGAVDVNVGDPIEFQLQYANGNLAVMLTDPMVPATYTLNYPFASLLPVLNGTDLAYVGFSGGTGGLNAIQTISNFEFNSVIPPMTLTASPVTANSFVLSWPAADPSYVLKQTGSLSAAWGPGPTPVVVGGVNQVTVTVPGGGGQQFYRLERIVCQ